MSAVIATCSFRKRMSTPMRLLTRSGPCIRASFRETPLDLAAQSKTTRSLDGFLGFSTGWCGRYHFVALVLTSSSGIFRACPFFKYSSITSVYFWCNALSFKKRFFKLAKRLSATPRLSQGRITFGLHGNGRM